MKYNIWFSIEDPIWEGYMPEEGEDPLYDEYEQWWSSPECDQGVRMLEDWCREWDDNAFAEGGTLYNPNGLEVYAEARFPEELYDSVMSAAQRKADEVTEYLSKTSPVEIQMVVRIEVED